MSSQLKIEPQNKELLDSLKEDFDQGRISRRELLKKALGAGLAAPVVYGLLGEMALPVSAQGPSATLQEINAEMPKIHDLNGKLHAIATNQAVVAELLRMEAAAPAERAKLAQAFISRVQQDAGFRRQIGAEIPGFRITTRIFEDPKAPRTLAEGDIVAKGPKIGWEDVV